MPSQVSSELRTLRFVRIRRGNMRSKPADNEFLKNITGCASADTDERILKGQPQSVAILSWIVKIRDTTGGQSTDDARVIQLPAPVVPLTDD